MIPENPHAIDGLEFIDMSDTDTVRPILRVQSENGYAGRQITQFHSSRERMNVNGCIMNRGVERKIELWRDLHGIDMTSWRDAPLVHQIFARFSRRQICFRYLRSSGSDMLRPCVCHARVTGVRSLAATLHHI